MKNNDFVYNNEDGVGININENLIKKIKDLYSIANYDKKEMEKYRNIVVYILPEFVIDCQIPEIIDRHFEIAMAEVEKNMEETSDLFDIKK